MSKPNFVYVTFIAAAPEKIWQALTDSQTSARYLSGFYVVVETKRGGASLFKNGVQVLNRGTVLSYDPPRRLSVTWRPELGEFSQEKPSRVTFEIEAIGKGQSRLTITHDDFQDGSKAATQVGEGWTRVASSLKSFVETGQGMDLLREVEGASA
ncbi:MAG: SRPBCC family protein [Xanthobacteraceae bacterium]|jgi:uncharacterized protein YndB with AHSA1/START domain